MRNKRSRGISREGPACAVIHRGKKQKRKRFLERRQVLPEERGVQERILCVKSNKRGPMEVTHFYMRAWADFGVPADTLGVRYICQRLRGACIYRLATVSCGAAACCSLRVAA